MLKAYSVFNDLNEEACKIIKSVGVQLDIADSNIRPNKEELIELFRQYDILIIGVKEKITKEMIEQLSSKKIIATLSIGLDHIDEELIKNDLIKVINCPNSNVISVAEHIFGLIFALKKNIIEANDISINGGNKTNLSRRSNDINKSTIGVIGAGKISREVIRIAKAFNMKICCNTLHPKKHQDLIKQNIKFIDLNDLLSNSDIITINIPLNRKTKNLISREKISLMKKNATFINTSRDEIVDIEELIRYADRNTTFNVGLDIDIDKYKSIFNKKRSNVIITPHIAGVSEEAINRMDIELANNIKDYLCNKENLGVDPNE